MRKKFFALVLATILTASLALPAAAVTAAVDADANAMRTTAIIGSVALPDLAKVEPRAEACGSAASPETAITTPALPPVVECYHYDNAIWAVRELTDGQIEVYLRNGMVVTIEKALLATWIAVQMPSERGTTTVIGLGWDEEELDIYGVQVCHEFILELLKALIVQGWTAYSADIIDDTAETSSASDSSVTASGVTGSSATTGSSAAATSSTMKPAAQYVLHNEVMRTQLMSKEPVLCQRLEAARGAGTKAYADVYFDRYKDGECISAQTFPVSFEFLADVNTYDGKTEFLYMSGPTAFLYGFYRTKGVWLDDVALMQIMRET